MPLTLSMRCGDDFYVGDNQVILREIHSSFQSVVALSSGQQFTVVADSAIEVLPEVFVSMGHEDQSNMVRLVIDAPREQLILTGRNYRKLDRSAVTRNAVVAEDVLRGAINLGLGDNLVEARERITRMVKLSAPYTHRSGNRRYKDFGFYTEAGQIKGVFKISEEVFEDVMCPDCQAVGGTCATCDSTGWVKKEVEKTIRAADAIGDHV